jgi:hypothetical protein
MKSCDQEYDAQRRNSNALKDAQGTGLEAQLILGVEGIGQERDARAEAREVQNSTIFEHGPDRSLMPRFWH